jgi:hypothetical protein
MISFFQVSKILVGFLHQEVKVCSIPQEEHAASNFRVTESGAGGCLSIGSGSREL